MGKHLGPDDTQDNANNQEASAARRGRAHGLSQVPLDAKRPQESSSGAQNSTAKTTTVESPTSEDANGYSVQGIAVTHQSTDGNKARGFGAAGLRGKRALTGRSVVGGWSRKKRRIVALILIAVLLFALVAIVYHKRHQVDYPDYEGQGTGSVLVEVPLGGSASSISTGLVDAGVVASAGAFMTAAEAHPQITNLQPGFYQLHHRMSAAAAVDYLLDPQRRVGAATLPEGVTLEDVRVRNGKTVPGIYSLLAEASCYSTDAGRQCLSANDFRQAVIESSAKQLGVASWAQRPVDKASDRARSIEGLIMPGLRIFDPRKSPRDILRDLIESSAQSYEESGLIDAAKARHLTPYELLVGASLIQREVAPRDYGKTARVIVNRMRKDMPLQFDSTVNYALQEQAVATSDAARAEKTPWNTYAMRGLPATPICSPTIEAVKAMEHPTPGPWLYFVTVDQQGTTVFNATLKEHERDVERATKNGVFQSS